MKQLNWSPLTQAMARARSKNAELPIWWRDDDAISVTPALERLANLSLALDIPVHAAVVPRLADVSLAVFIADRDHVVPLAHGWDHANHAPPGAKKAEFGHPRQGAETEILQAKAEMTRLFGAHFVPMFVPPWNRLDLSFLQPLKEADFKAVSTYGPRRSRQMQNGLLQINTHVDPIDWHTTRGLKDPQYLISHVGALISARLDGSQDATEPLGYLTHHLVHNDDLWHFSEQLLKRLLDGGATAQPVGHILETSK